MRYEKEPISIAQQIDRLKGRGLAIPDDGLAARFLQNVSYYRLRAYTYPFQENREGLDHIFVRDGIRFEDVMDLYYFDKRMRFLLFSAIEKIEVALRARITLAYSIDQGSGFWFLNHKLYHDHEKFVELTRNETIDGRKYRGDLPKEVLRSKEDFITHYYSRYGDPALPPAWMTLEVASMGVLSKLFSALDKRNAPSKAICEGFGLKKVEILRNWMFALAAMRNACAHHSRVWNRRFVLNLSFPHDTASPFLSEKEIKSVRNNKLFAYLSVIHYLLGYVDAGGSFRRDLFVLLRGKPKLVEWSDMGFPPGWEHFALWK